MKPNLTYYHNKDLIRLRVQHAFKELIAFKKKEDKDAFNTQLLEVLPEVKKYINTQLNTAIKKGHFSKNKYVAEDFLDQLFIEIYDHIDEVKKENDFYLWLFKKTNNLIEDVIIEEEFDDFFFKNIDTYSKPEWDTMQEEFTTDGDGDLIMLDELDDSSYTANTYNVNHIFIEDNETELTLQLDKDLHEDEVNRHIKMVLHNLPLPMRSVFELVTQQHLNLEEIAQLKHTTFNEIKAYFDAAKKALQVSLFNRYETKQNY
ncbi:sigma-70 family RNA polymerase sigma factor [Winogradskyella sp.]|nr:sigma-70 family RNA polymerase sigma factor [Winogradskyella sp.]